MNISIGNFPQFGLLVVIQNPGRNNGGWWTPGKQEEEEVSQTFLWVRKRDPSSVTWDFNSL